jgi:hypothetical protein
MQGSQPNHYLVAGAALTAVAALLHLACIAFGASWYRAMGAGEHMARMAEAGDWRAAAITLAITWVLALWAAYALSAAGLLPRLPLLRVAMCAITAVYLLRGLAGLLLALTASAALTPERSPAFWLWSSAICLALGGIHLLGLRQAWPTLSH